MSLLIAISGSGGGNKGPQGIYPCLQQLYGSDNLRILPFETLPNDIDKNVEEVSKVVLSNAASYKNIYLVGYSMGGAVAALAANKINDTHQGTVKGLVFLDTQTDGLIVLKKLKIPALFYHGKEDQCFPAWQIESVYRSYSGPKRMVELEGLDHDLSQGSASSKEFSQDLAKDIFAEISNFFFNEGLKEPNERNEIITRSISLTPKEKNSALYDFFLSFFQK